MFSVSCVPADDPQFANSARAIATYLLQAQPLCVPRRGSWEIPLRRAFGYQGAEARIRRMVGGSPTVTLYRDGDPRRAANARGRTGADPTK